MRRISTLICGTLLLAGLQNFALAADPPCYAILSLVGDKLDVAVFQPDTGSRIERTTHVDLPITGSALDDVAVSAVGQAVGKLVPGAILVRLASSSPVLYDRQREIFEEKSLVISLPGAIVTAMKNEKATHLILVTKVRDEARLRTWDSYTGTGVLDGLGFYVDRVTVMTQPAGGETGTGYLAPFVYFKISLIDAQTLKIRKEVVVREAYALSAGRARETGHPWDVLTTEQKGGTIAKMLREEIARAMPDLLKAGPAL